MSRGRRDILIFVYNKPWKSVKGFEEASRITGVPVYTIKYMINNPPKRPEDIKNGGYSSPEGWGFDYLAQVGD